MMMMMMMIGPKKCVSGCSLGKKGITGVEIIFILFLLSVHNVPCYITQLVKNKLTHRILSMKNYSKITAA